MYRFALSAGILAAVGCLSLHAQTITVKATIPFEFQLGAQTLPAGDYYVFHSDHVLRLRAAGGPIAAMALTSAAAPEPNASPSKLVFRRYGNEYFLAKVWIGYARSGVAVPPVKRERELIAAARHSSPTTFALAAK